MVSRFKLEASLKNITLGECVGLMPDANVWLFIYGDIDYHKPYQTRVYSNFLKIVKENKTPLYTTPVVLSEFHNRMIKSPFERLRQECKEKEQEIPKWKSFRNSGNGIEALESAADNISYILEDCEVIDLVSNSKWLVETSDSLSKSCGELNDAYIEKVCADNNIALVTDDGDFINSNITIYSANGKLCI
ncbi:MAG: hypothetical protein JKY55_03715 [Aliivibrio sp.]|uniref:hypothetical protein n=1 Tax=Aliivibrio sp. TaxID=1872443 RepID=UPI001A3E7C41|nr:hypothetical protein [Aliivibrio sp.]